MRTPLYRTLCVVLSILLVLPAWANAQLQSGVTYVIYHPVLGLEVDVNASGDPEAVRYTFTEVDPEGPEPQPYLALRAPDPEPLREAAPLVTLTPEAQACVPPEDLSVFSKFKNLTQDELDDVAKVLHLSFGSKAASRSAQTSLAISGAAALKLGYSMVHTATRVFGASAVAGSTIAFQAKMLGPIELTAGTLAARTFTVVVGGTGVGLVALGAAAITIALVVIEPQKPKWRDALVKSEIFTCDPTGACFYNEDSVQGTMYGDFSFLTFEEQRVIAQMQQDTLGPPPQEAGGCGHYNCGFGLFGEILLPCTWSYAVIFNGELGQCCTGPYGPGPNGDWPVEPDGVCECHTIHAFPPAP